MERKNAFFVEECIYADIMKMVASPVTITMIRSYLILKAWVE